MYGDSRRQANRFALAAAALALLAGCGAPAVDALIERAQTAPPEERRAAAIALGGRTDAAAEAVPALAAVLHDVAQPEAVRVAAAIALGGLGARLADEDDAQQKYVESVVAALTSALSDANVTLRTTAAASLARMTPHAAAAAPALLRANLPGYRELREQLLDTIEQSGYQAVEPALLAALADDDPEVRSLAAEAAGRFQQAAASAVPALVARLTDERTDVRALAAESLGKIGAAATQAVPNLVAELDSSEPQVRTTAAEILGKIGPPAVAARAPLMARLDDPQWYVRASAARALGHIGPGGDRVVLSLIDRLRDDHWFVRAAAAQALGQAGPAGRAAVPELIEALKDRERMVRSRAAQALALIEPEVAEQAGANF